MGRASGKSTAVTMAAAVPAEALTAVEPMADRTMTLDDLLQHAREGDETAFAEIVTRFERLVRGVILRMTGDAELSDDLTQNVFLKFWRVLPAFTTAASLPSWMKKVAINNVISHWRRAESQRRRIEAMAQAFPHREVRGPAAQLIDEEDRDQVRSALEMMPADLRSILTLRTYENMSYEELADTLGLEIGTVRSRLFRARQMVRDTLTRWRRHEQLGPAGETN